jgi:hypothetical protein
MRFYKIYIKLNALLKVLLESRISLCYKSFVKRLEKTKVSTIYIIIWCFSFFLILFFQL